uniref:Glycine-rich protein DC7.1 n=1 Tax=Nicotiana tabacum TaxID=4097 RepID=A0A1S3YNK5_TOBAC|nr:PREDICTED: glycine-rich protein DC7.1-like [Nicotiana tabacum]
MGSKAFLFLGLCLAIFIMISSEVLARELSETSTTTEEDPKKSNSKNEVHEAQYGGGGYPSGGGGYSCCGGRYPGGDRGGGEYMGGSKALDTEAIALGPQNFETLDLFDILMVIVGIIFIIIMVNIIISALRGEYFVITSLTTYPVLSHIMGSGEGSVDADLTSNLVENIL